MKRFFFTILRKLNWISDEKPRSQSNVTVIKPIRNVIYQDQLRIVKDLESLTIGGSFYVRNEQVRVVRRIANDQFPEYKIRIVNFGTSYRAFRRA